MSVSAEKYMPPNDDLIIPEITLTKNLLKATTTHLGVYCDQQFKVLSQHKFGGWGMSF